MRELFVKYSSPTKFDHAPYGTRWKSIINEDSCSTYIQLSKDENDPKWVEFGSFLVDVHEDLITDELVCKMYNDQDQEQDVTLIDFYLHVYEKKTSSPDDVIITIS